MAPIAQAESDIRLNARLNQACRRERGMFCADVESDNSGKVIECLEENRKQAAMSAKCLAAIKRNMIIESRNVMLNRPLLKACYGNFHTICNAQRKSRLSNEESDALINCMLDKREQVVCRHFYASSQPSTHKSTSPSMPHRCAAGPARCTSSER